MRVFWLLTVFDEQAQGLGEVLKVARMQKADVVRRVEDEPKQTTVSVTATHSIEQFVVVQNFDGLPHESHRVRRQNAASPWGSSAAYPAIPTRGNVQVAEGAHHMVDLRDAQAAGWNNAAVIAAGTTVRGRKRGG